MCVCMCVNVINSYVYFIEKVLRMDDSSNTERNQNASESIMNSESSPSECERVINKEQPGMCSYINASVRCIKSYTYVHNFNL